MILKEKFNKIKIYFIAHKIIVIVSLIILISLGYFFYKKSTSTSTEVRYITSKVAKGVLISSISGSGQVSASNQIDIKSNVSGNIIYVGIKPGDNVYEGKTLFTIDDTEAKKSVRDAELSLESAQISLNKIKIQNSNDNLNSTLAKSFDDGFNTVSNVFLDLPSIMTGLNDIFFKSSTVSGQQLNIDWYAGQVTETHDRDKADILKQNLIDSFTKAQNSYTTNLENYKIVSRTSDSQTIENLIKQTYEDTKLISDVIKNGNNYIDFVNNVMQKNSATIPSIINTHKTNLNTYTSETNSHLIDLLNSTTSIKNNKDAFFNADLDNQSTELSLRQKQNALADARDKLKDYYISTPFSGTTVSVPVQRKDSINSGTTLATIITNQKIATISLNEVDIAKIKLNQKVTLSFDAISELTITGKVVQIDSVGTVSQGVVNYNIKISFDTNDERIKPGMSVNASIITDTKQDVLYIPNSSIKNKSGNTYVEIFDTPLVEPLQGNQGSPSPLPPTQILVVTGISNENSTEIISGLKEGDEIVSRTITPTITSTTAPSILGSTNTRNTGAARIPSTR